MGSWRTSQPAIAKSLIFDSWKNTKEKHGNTSKWKLPIIQERTL